MSEQHLKRGPLEHDILVARRNTRGKQFFKVKARRERDETGQPPERAEYFAIQEQSPAAAGFRSIMNFACPETHEQLGAAAASNRGPALATMPLHPDPTASASCTCYLINPENLTYETAWTSQEWSNPSYQPASGAASPDANPREADSFEVLLASP